MSLIRSFNTKSISKFFIYRGYLMWFAKTNYINKIFVYYTTSIRLNEITYSKKTKIFGKCFNWQILFKT